MKEKLYFEDYPISDYTDDFVGFESEVKMLKEGIESNSKIIGLVAEYGSGKSSIIELLNNNLEKDKYDVININLLDPDAKNEDLEAHKRMLIQIANQKFRNNKNQLSHVIKRLNPNYKSIDISTKSKLSWIGIITAILLFCISFLYKNNILSYFNCFTYPQYAIIISFLRNFAKISGILGFLTLFITLIKSDIVCNYLKNGDNQELNEFDLIEISKDLIDDTKTTIVIIEDFDRNTAKNDLERFVKELNVYYENMENTIFIITLNPKQFYDMSSNNDSADNKYKPFNMIIDIPNIKNSDYEIIAKQLLKSKSSVLKTIGINVESEEKLNCWTWLSLGKNMNIRRLKHRINYAIHLYVTLTNRFKEQSIKIETCIAIAYLKDEYEEEYDKLLKPDNESQFKLKSEIENYISGKELDEKATDFNKDLKNLVEAGYIDYNCEMYCYNYSKHNKVFDVYESELVNNYMYDRKYKIDDSKIEEIIKTNPKCLKDVIDKRIVLGIGIPTNVFDRKSVINFILKNTTEEDQIKFFNKLLSIDELHIKTTADRLAKIKTSDFFEDDNLKLYIKEVSKQLQASENIKSIGAIRVALLDIIDNVDIIEELYSGSYPIITSEEMKKIGNLDKIIDLIDFSKVNFDNIKYITEVIDILYKEDYKNSMLYVLDNIYDEVIDYFCKNCKSLARLTDSEKQEVFEQNKEYINLSTLKEIQTLTNNIDYSFKETEEEVISMLDSHLISIKQYESYINELPNVNACTLNRLLKDDCTFSIRANILDEYEKRKYLYGYVKYKTINDCKIPTNKKKYREVYEKMYSNANHIFDDYIIDNSVFLNYIRDMKIYEKYGNDRFIIMAHCSQTTELLNYAFKSLSDTSMISEYINEIETIDCDEIEFGALLLNYKSIIVGISSEAYKHLQSFIKNKSIKAKLRCVRSGKNVQNNIYS